MNGSAMSGIRIVVFVVLLHTNLLRTRFKQLIRTQVFNIQNNFYSEIQYKKQLLKTFNHAIDLFLIIFLLVLTWHKQFLFQYFSKEGREAFAYIGEVDYFSEQEKLAQVYNVIEADSFVVKNETRSWYQGYLLWLKSNVNATTLSNGNKHLNKH